MTSRRENKARASPPNRQHPDSSWDKVAHVVWDRLAEGKRVRRTLPGGGRLHVDRILPFLYVYRHPPAGPDPALQRLVAGEAAYLLASGRKRERVGVARVVQALAELAQEQFGAFLVLELWRAELEATPSDEETLRLRPVFQILAQESGAFHTTIGAFAQALGRVDLSGGKAEVQTRVVSQIKPPGLGPLLRPEEIRGAGAHLLGIAMEPVYEDPESGEHFPLVLRSLRRQLGRALKRGMYAFTRQHAVRTPPSFQALGRRAVVKAVWKVDAQLAEIADAFDFLLAVTPFNMERAWTAFSRSRYDKAPDLWYRPIPVDPELTKRRLFNLPIERIEDPSLADLFRGKQRLLDQQLTMLQDRGQRRFLYGSLALYGRPPPELLSEAEEVLRRTPVRERPRDGRAEPAVDAQAFAERAAAEMAQYRRQLDTFAARVELRDDVAGLMTSQGNLLIDRKLRVPPGRVDALLHHEIGTHSLTYYNGIDQPLRQLYSGLPRYDELQEGLAVLAEYLVGGLSRDRLRLLAARVMATQSMVDGATFVDTFRLLQGQYRFPKRTAFFVTARVHRSGGFTKDMVYLLGLSRILGYLAEGGDLAILTVGKVHFDQVGLVKELLLRGVLHPPRLRPRYLDLPEAQARLALLRQKRRSVVDLIQRRELS